MPHISGVGKTRLKKNFFQAAPRDKTMNFFPQAH